MSATLQDDVPLDNTFGAVIIGVIVSAVLHGVCLLQAFYYFQKYKKDGILVKVLVTVLVLFDAIHLCFIAHTAYHYTITNFHDEAKLKVIVWSVVMEALLTGLNGAFVQIFYTYRVWKLSGHNWIITGFILSLIMCCAGCGTAWVIISMQLNTYEQLLKITPLTVTINALSTTIDMLIALSLVYLLNRARTGFKRSNTMINKLILFIVSTGVLTTLCAIAALISLIASSRTLIYASFYFCIGRLYVNSFLATLNARSSIADPIDKIDHMLISLSQSAFSSTPQSQPNISIQIDTTHEAVHEHAAMHMKLQQMSDDKETCAESEKGPGDHSSKVHVYSA